MIAKTERQVLIYFEIFQDKERLHSIFFFQDIFRRCAKQDELQKFCNYFCTTPKKLILNKSKLLKMKSNDDAESHIFTSLNHTLTFMHKNIFQQTDFPLRQYPSDLTSIVRYLPKTIQLLYRQHFTIHSSHLFHTPYNQQYKL